MKKVFILLLSVVALLAFTIPAMALHATKEGYEFTPSVVKTKGAQLDFDGSIRIRGRHSDNTSDFRDTLTDGSQEDSFERYDQRVRLGIKATVSPNTLGYIELENGTSNTSDGITWGANSFGEGAQGIYQESNSKRGNVWIRQAYIAHQGTGLTGNMAGFKAGHMLLSLGDGWFYNHTQFGDDAIVLHMMLNDTTEVSLTTIKLNEGANVTQTANAITDDANAHVLALTTEAGGAAISADLTWVNDNAFARGATITDTAQGGSDMNLYNFGLRGKMAVGGVNISADVEFQNGEVTNYRNDSGDMDIGGWAFILGADTKVGDASVWAKFGIGSGDDIDKNDEYDQFITSLSQGQKFTYVYDNFACTAATGGPSATGASSSYSCSTNTGIANTTFIGVGASANVNPDVKVEGAFYWLSATEKVAATTATTSDSTDIGFEIDGKITYQIDTNLVYYLETGWLFADDFYKNVTAVDTTDPDDAYSVRHGIVLSF